MNTQDLMKKSRASVNALLYKQGYVSIVDVLMDLHYLDKKDYEDWRHGRIPYLERVCHTNLNKLSLICKQVRSYALSLGCKESFTYYKRWRKGSKQQLRFSKSGDAKIERYYATHYVNMSLKKKQEVPVSNEDDS